MRYDVLIYAFDKLDGSNIRAEWNSKKGFYKFGTRHQLINEKTVPFGDAISLIKQKYEEQLTKIFEEQNWKNVVCFFEYYGSSSFAGNHCLEEVMNVTLIDVNPFKCGILLPGNFIELFESLEIPRICYKGYINENLFGQIKNNTLPGMTFERCVCKGNDNGKLIMFKIKSKAWLDKLKRYCNGNEDLFQKLS